MRRGLADWTADSLIASSSSKQSDVISEMSAVLQEWLANNLQWAPSLSTEQGGLDDTQNLLRVSRADLHKSWCSHCPDLKHSGRLSETHLYQPALRGCRLVCSPDVQLATAACSPPMNVDAAVVGVTAAVWFAEALSAASMAVAKASDRPSGTCKSNTIQVLFIEPFCWQLQAETYAVSPAFPGTAAPLQGMGLSSPSGQ